MSSQLDDDEDRVFFEQLARDFAKKRAEDNTEPIEDNTEPVEVENEVDEE